MIYFELFIIFFKIGAFTFGGGYAMLPLIKQEIEAHGWMDNEQLVNFIAVSESTPGPFAVNISTYTGMTVGGIFGAFCATLGVVMPSFIIIILVAKCYEKFKESKGVAGAMNGLKPAVVGLIGAAVISVGQTVFYSNENKICNGNLEQFLVTVAIFGIAIMCSFKKVHPIIIICLSALAGITAGFILKI